MSEMVTGKRMQAALWVTTARRVLEDAKRLGLSARIEEAGGRLVADTCLVVSPVRSLRIRSLATNSAKMAYYSRTYNGLQVRFGSLDRCIESAITGRWTWGT